MMYESEYQSTATSPQEEALERVKSHMRDYGNNFDNQFNNFNATKIGRRKYSFK